MTDTPDSSSGKEQPEPVRGAPLGSMKAMLIVTLICSLIALGLSGAALITALKHQNGPQQSIDFSAQMRAYIEDHPEVIIESLNQAESRQKEGDAKEATNQQVAHSDEIFRDPAAPFVGNPNGDAILVEFFDYNCPYCKKATPVLDQLIQSDKGLKIVYKELPILGPGSNFAAHAALAAQRQGKYVEFHNALFAAHGPITEASTLSVASAVGLDLDRLKKDMADPAIETAIKNNIALAEALRISGTPTFVSRKGIVPGLVGFDALKQMIADARKGSHK